jgi:hypothetical protein
MFDVQIHYDNFTIVLMETAWLLLTVMVGLALWTRRSNYELFYFTHIFGVIFYILAIVHAWSFWYCSPSPPAPPNARLCDASVCSCGCG